MFSKYLLSSLMPVPPIFSQGQAMYTGPELGFTSLVYPEDPGNSNETFSG